MKLGGRDARGRSDSTTLTLSLGGLRVSHESTSPPDQGRWHSRGYLPHFDRSELTQFITCHLAGSLPKHVLQRWRAELPNQGLVEEQILLQKRIEKYLDQGYGAAYLKQPRLAMMVQNSLLHFDGERY